MDSNYLFAFSLAFLAGICTAIGGAISFFIKPKNLTFLALALGFSAGVMIYVSFMEILPEAENAISISLGNKMGSWFSVMGFFGGIGIAALIDRFIPCHIESAMFEDDHDGKKHKLHRVGVFTAIALAIHNFPEGLATFMAGISDVTLGISIAIAIAIHNIPEGISVAMPIYHATNSRKKAFAYSFIAGMAEPVGALMGFFLLRYLFNDVTFGLLFAIVAGIMVYISFDELLPMAREYGKGHLEIIGVTLGMFVMAVSLLLF